MCIRDRDEAAIAESRAKYGGYCYQIAFRILALREDAEECVGDTWLRAWEAMPPSRPGKMCIRDRYVPGLFFFLGTGDTPQLHAPDFTFDDEAVLPRGVEFLKKLLMLP